MNGIDITRRVYRRLKMPSQQALPYKYVLETVGEVISRKRLDLALSSQNSLGVTGDWFTPSETDFALDDGILLPIRVERRGIDSDIETGEDVDITNYSSPRNNPAGTVSFYGDPLRMVFRDELDYVSTQQYRLFYEPDFEGETTLESVVGLPEYFKSMVVLESCWELLDQIEDSSAEFMEFYKMVSAKWPAQIAMQQPQWERFVRQFRGNRVVKTTFWDGRNTDRRLPRIPIS